MRGMVPGKRVNNAAVPKNRSYVAGRKTLKSKLLTGRMTERGADGQRNRRKDRQRQTETDTGSESVVFNVKIGNRVIFILLRLV